MHGPRFGPVWSSVLWTEPWYTNYALEQAWEEDQLAANAECITNIEKAKCQVIVYVWPKVCSPLLVLFILELTYIWIGQFWGYCVQSPRWFQVAIFCADSCNPLRSGSFAWRWGGGKVQDLQPSYPHLDESLSWPHHHSQGWWSHIPEGTWCCPMSGLWSPPLWKPAIQAPFLGEPSSWVHVCSASIEEKEDGEAVGDINLWGGSGGGGESQVLDLSYMRNAQAATYHFSKIQSRAVGFWNGPYYIWHHNLPKSQNRANGDWPQHNLSKSQNRAYSDWPHDFWSWGQCTCYANTETSLLPQLFILVHLYSLSWIWHIWHWWR